MKLPIKQVYFEKIKKGTKTIDYRDAHITFICEETGERLSKKVKSVSLVPRSKIPKSAFNPLLFEDNTVIAFELE
jgi:hypothetical protein